MAQRVAIVEDDQDVSKRFAGLLQEQCPDLTIDQWHTVEDAERAFGNSTYDLVVMDIMFGHDRYAGIGMIDSLNRKQSATPTPVLVVSGLQADQFRGLVKKLGVYDFLEKPVEPHDFVPTAMQILREKKDADARQPVRATPLKGLYLDPLKGDPLWNGKTFNLPITAQRILNAIYEAKSKTVTYEELFDLVKTGTSKDNIRKYIAEIKAAIREVDPAFDALKTDRIKGYFWQD